MNKYNYLIKHLLMALKIGFGCSLAIFLATEMNLDNAVSAGTITLLSLLGTRWESVRISVYRLITFGFSVIIAWVLFLHIDHNLVAYGIFVFLMVLIAEELGWRTTISVNAVIGAHFFISHDFSRQSIFNEFALVGIGIIVSLILNLFQDNHNRKKGILADMQYTEEKLQYILQEIAAYLMLPKGTHNGSGQGSSIKGNSRPEKGSGGRKSPGTGRSADVWEEISSLETKLHGFMDNAHEYQENTFHSLPLYYIDYFEMRYDQCQVLYGLHSSMRQLRSVPTQAIIVADYIYYLRDHVVEKNDPSVQEKRLNEIIDSMKKDSLPETRDEFESRALVFHILMDLESFLYYKRTFVDKLEEKRTASLWDRIFGTKK